MAALATPPPATPNAPGTPLTPPIAAPQSTVHTKEDAVYNRIATAMTAAANAQNAAPAAPVTPTPEAPPVATTPEVPVETAPVVEAPASTEVNPEDVDFDATPEVAPAATEVAAKQLLSDSQIEATLQEMLARNEVPEKIEEAFLKHSRGKQMLTAFKTQRELAKSPEEGGLGRIPSIDEIRQGDVARREVDAMRFEYAENPESFSNNLFVFDPQTGVNAMGASPQHALRMLETIPQTIERALQETKHPLYAQMMAAYSMPVFNRFLNTQYQEALAMPTESQDQIRTMLQGQQVPPLADAKARRLDALQLIETTLLGRPRPLNLNAGMPSQGSGQGEPTEVAELRRQLEQERGLRRQGEQVRVNGLRTNVENAAKTSAMTDIDKLLDQTGVTKIHAPAILGPHKNELYADVHRSLKQFDPGGWQNYEIQMARVASGNGDETAAAAQYRQLFRNALRHLPAVKERLQGLVVSAKANSDAQHTSHAQSALRTEPGSSGVAAPQPVLSAAQIARQPGETKEDFLTRRFAAAMTNGQPRA